MILLDSGFRRNDEKWQIPTFYEFIRIGSDYDALLEALGQCTIRDMNQRILEMSDGMQVPVIDLAGRLRENFGKSEGRWFFPNEGHLTPEGHRVVANILLPLVKALR